MNKPLKLAYSDDAVFQPAKGGLFVFLAIAALGFGLALATSNATIQDLALPCGAVSCLGLIWFGILALVAWGRRLGERQAIDRLFREEIWECWKFSSPEWGALVEAECALICPPDEGIQAYQGAVYSSILGAFLALIMIAVGTFAIQDPTGKLVLWIGAGAVFLLLLFVGLVQPLTDRLESVRYRRKALTIAEPRVWYGPSGIYHETLGYTSLADLERVTDQTGSRKAIQFTLTVSTETADDSVAYPFPVPTGCEERASRLVLRYRQELRGTS